MQKKLFFCLPIPYTMPMTDNTTTKTDYDKFSKERNAASDLRVSLAYISGYLKPENPEISELIQKALDQHQQDREQDLWF